MRRDFREKKTSLKGEFEVLIKEEEIQWPFFKTIGIASRICGKFLKKCLGRGIINTSTSKICMCLIPKKEKTQGERL